MAKQHTPPTQEEVRLRFTYDPETGVLWHTSYNKMACGWHGKEAGHLHHDGYRNVVIRGKLYQIHRVIWLYVYGEMPDGHIDHISRCRDDNRICNLRIVTRSQNKHNGNTYANNTSGVPGVYFMRSCGRWYARINVGGIRRNLGSFVNFEDAVAARRRAKAALDAVIFALNPDNQEAP